MTLTRLHKQIVLVAGILTSTTVIFGYIGLSLPTPVWAEEFNALKLDVYKEILQSNKKELRSIKIQEYQIIQAHQPVPEFLIQEKLELEDKVKELESVVNRLEK